MPLEARLICVPALETLLKASNVRVLTCLTKMVNVVLYLQNMKHINMLLLTFFYKSSLCLHPYKAASLVFYQWVWSDEATDDLYRHISSDSEVFVTSAKHFKIFVLFLCRQLFPVISFDKPFINPPNSR